MRGIIGLVGPAGYSSRAHTHTHTGGREREGRELPVPSQLLRTFSLETNCLVIMS